jgi:lipopolysaccharide heptosyltransferase II
MSPDAPPWSSALNVLCVRLDSIGDVLMTTPAIRALKESVPGRKLTLLTSPAGAEIARLVPEIDDAIIYNAPWMKATPEGAGSSEARRVTEHLKRLQFDGAIIFTVYSQNPLAAAHMCYMADIPRRLAYCRENPYQLLTDWAPELEPLQPPRHEVMRQLELAKAIGCSTNDKRLSLRVPEGAHQSIVRLLHRLNIDETGTFAIIHPGATAPSRRYPAESFARVGDCMAKDFGMQVLFTGSRTELPLVETIRGHMSAGSLSVAGHLGLDELAALLTFSSLLVSNNTGPAHMAAALGTPVVSLYALTNPQHIPWSVPSRVLYHDVGCKYCYKSVCPHGHNDCLRLLSPSEVLSAISDLIRETRSTERVQYSM